LEAAMRAIRHFSRLFRSKRTMSLAHELWTVSGMLSLSFSWENAASSRHLLQTVGLRTSCTFRTRIVEMYVLDISV
jgi:hypothetical protein